MTQTQLLSQLTLRFQNQDILDGADLIQLISEALIDYNASRPQQIIEDLTGTDTTSLALPSVWETNFSQILSLEIIELEDGEEISTLMNADEYEIYQSPTETYIKCSDDTDSDYTYRITFTTQHIISDSECTPSDKDTLSILAHATSNGFYVLASATISQIDQEMGNAIIEGRRGRKSPSEEYLNLAQKYDIQWRKAMNLPVDDSQAQPNIAAISLEWRGEGNGKLNHRFF